MDQIVSVHGRLTGGWSEIAGGRQVSSAHPYE
jgi:hypothetical protein